MANGKKVELFYKEFETFNPRGYVIKKSYIANKFTPFL